MDNWTKSVINGVEEEGAVMTRGRKELKGAAVSPVVVAASSANVAVGVGGSSSSEDKSNAELQEKGRSLDEGVAGRQPAPADNVSDGGEEDDGEDDEEWLVEKIIKKRISKAGAVEYQVQWVGWDSSYNTWEPPEHLTNSPLILAEFEQKEKEKNERRAKRARKE